MVAALNEQRAGLNDTLALLDSMLANAPIGFSFFDRKARFVRVNQFWAEMDNLSISRHLGRAVHEIFPNAMAVDLAGAMEHVFSTGSPVRDLELHFELASMPGNPRTWLVSLYPVRIGGQRITSDPATGNEAGAGPPSDAAEAGQVRWVGAVVVDTTDRKMSEEMLRRTEKLAATGRLAASIAHEINNPLEAVTNLLYLLHQQPLDTGSPAIRRYGPAGACPRLPDYPADIALLSRILEACSDQPRRVAGVRSQPSSGAVACSQGGSRPPLPRTIRALLAFGGEMRQLFANLVGNALDAMPKGGRLILSVRPSLAWNQSRISRRFLAFALWSRIPVPA